MTIIKSIYNYANVTGDIKISEDFITFIRNSENPFSRKNREGHITGSAWIISNNYRQALLTHHKKLNIWIQTGGHSEGETDPFITAKREAEEETGLELLSFDGEIFSLDIHNIPAHENSPEHKHYDITYLFTPQSSHNFKVSRESHDLRWVDINSLESYTKEKNILRMGKITHSLLKNSYTTILNN